MKYLSVLILILCSCHLRGQSIYFPPASGTEWETMPIDSLGWCQENLDDLYAYLDDNNTKAFLLLKDGKIVLEKYFGTHTATTLWQWASAGKTVTSFLVGIAQQEGKLSLSDATSKYLGKGWTNCTPEQEDKITIRHQLTMTSGLDDNVPDHFCTLDTCLIFKADAGTRWAYHNGPYTLLDGVMEKATGVSMNQYTAQKLKSATGMNGTFFPVGYNNVFFSNARSMARFGLLILNKGNWNGKQVMTDSAYFNQMVNTSQSLNPSYGYLWWLNGKSKHMLPGSQFVFNGPMQPNAPSDMIAAMGKDGQFLNVVPGEKLVWVRMGNAPDNLPVPSAMNNKIWEYINLLKCIPSETPEIALDKNWLSLAPNPASTFIKISIAKPVKEIRLYNSQGVLLKNYAGLPPGNEIQTEAWPQGVYILQVTLEDGTMSSQRFVKE
jgi:CubicO group peptidase (beta-lactamase class C family)